MTIRILVVDDDDQIRTSLAEALSDDNAEVRTVEERDHWFSEEAVHGKVGQGAGHGGERKVFYVRQFMEGGGGSGLPEGAVLRRSRAKRLPTYLPKPPKAWAGGVRLQRTRSRERARWSSGGQSAAEGGGAKRWPEEDHRALSLPRARKGVATPAQGPLP